MKPQSVCVLGSVMMSIVTISPLYADDGRDGRHGENVTKVEVVNTPSVQAQQKGDWSVEIKGTPGVTIENPTDKPVPVTVMNGSGSNSLERYRVAGVSSTAVNGDIGLDGMFNTCQTDFGPSARVCTSEEIFQTPDFANKLALPAFGNAWINPVIVSAFYNPEIGVVQNIDISGVVTHKNNLNCGDWTGLDASAGLVIIRGGATQLHTRLTLPCNVAKPVACCTPQ